MTCNQKNILGTMRASSVRLIYCADYKCSH
jgi:hypothetical protein